MVEISLAGQIPPRLPAPIDLSDYTLHNKEPRVDIGQSSLPEPSAAAHVTRVKTYIEAIIGV